MKRAGASHRQSRSGRPARPLVAVLMGSASDWEMLRPATEVLGSLGVPHETRVISAHRAPAALAEYVDAAEARGIRVLIAGAGGAAHLPGVVAARTTLPVLGVPVPSGTLGGLDALLSMVQMPRGVPVGTLAIGESGAANAALLAAEILALSDAALRKRLTLHRERQTARSLKTRL
ncbi:MAG TPA: 5-(carboxyamino)imidazole ribonucleotide mutase [Candidatus Saccharimonadales bacterium]|nr:5-(carboxyamino)imidazole ribonucleotide mutase [Candidatus Saccharimonadales bacterium]